MVLHPRSGRAAMIAVVLAIVLCTGVQAQARRLEAAIFIGSHRTQLWHAREEQVEGSNYDTLDPVPGVGGRIAWSPGSFLGFYVEGTYAAPERKVVRGYANRPIVATAEGELRPVRILRSAAGASLSFPSALQHPLHITLRAGPMLRLVRSTPAIFDMDQDPFVANPRLVADPDGPVTYRDAGIHAGAELGVRFTERTKLLLGAATARVLNSSIGATDRDRMIYAGGIDRGPAGRWIHTRLQ
jgi:hypothetical protein